jgi:hypothetical protein
MSTATAKERSALTKLCFTGSEYLESLRDEREVWIFGERVKDVTTHPAFRNSARSIARLYDALRDPELAPILTRETDTGSGGFTHPFFRPPSRRSARASSTFARMPPTSGRPSSGRSSTATSAARVARPPRSVSSS